VVAVFHVSAYRRQPTGSSSGSGVTGSAGTGRRSRRAYRLTGTPTATTATTAASAHHLNDRSTALSYTLLTAADKVHSDTFIRTTEAALELLRQAGFSPQEAFLIASHLLHDVIGLVASRTSPSAWTC